MLNEEFSEKNFRLRDENGGGLPKTLKTPSTT
jgi:hypothetical protein